MADEADLAQPHIEARLDNALARSRRARAGVGREDCEDCGEGIPEDRRKAVPGCRRCVTCQRGLEQRSRIYAGAR